MMGGTDEENDLENKSDKGKYIQYNIINNKYLIFFILKEGSESEGEEDESESDSSKKSEKENEKENESLTGNLFGGNSEENEES